MNLTPMVLASDSPSLQFSEFFKTDENPIPDKLSKCSFVMQIRDEDLP